MAKTAWLPLNLFLLSLSLAVAPATRADVIIGDRPGWLLTGAVHTAYVARTVGANEMVTVLGPWSSDISDLVVAPDSLVVSQSVPFKLEAGRQAMFTFEPPVECSPSVGTFRLLVVGPDVPQADQASAALPFNL
jgi:hypothetical protein